MGLRHFDTLIYPPSICILLLLAGLLFWKKRIFSLLCISSATLVLLLSSSPLFSEYLIRSLETYPPLSPEHLASQPAEAIVLPGGGVHLYKTEYGSETPGYATLERIRYAALIHRKTRLPILISEGLSPGLDKTGAQIMAEVFKTDYGIDHIIMEDQAMSTRENAQYSARILRQRGINTIFLVTHSWHMPRSVYSFRQSGLDVIPAPTLATDTTISLRDFVPAPRALQKTRTALHEYLGLLWYQLQD